MLGQPACFYYGHCSGSR